MYVLSIMIAKRFPGIGGKKWFQLLAHYSMYIYLFHDPLEYVVLKIAFGHNWLLYRTGCLLYMGMRTAGVIAVSIFLGFVIEKGKRRLRERGWDVDKEGIITYILHWCQPDDWKYAIRQNFCNSSDKSEPLRIFSGRELTSGTWMCYTTYGSKRAENVRGYASASGMAAGRPYGTGRWDKTGDEEKVWNKEVEVIQEQ